jgi:hypothetical protein
MSGKVALGPVRSLQITIGHAKSRPLTTLLSQFPAHNAGAMPTYPELAPLTQLPALAVFRST